MQPETETPAAPAGTVPNSAALRALLEGIVDYAGLFPPSKLEMAQAVARYSDALVGPNAWMLGRFVVPVARLAEFEAEAEARLATLGNAGWRLSALGGGDAVADFIEIEDFNERMGGRAVVDSFETRVGDVGEVTPIAELVPQGITAYLEIAIDRDPVALVEAAAEAGVRAKMRTGGITPDAFPEPTDVLRFLRACARAEVPFKATAGLHHPLRAEHPLTYEPGCARGLMYGFLNVFLAAAFLRSGVEAREVARLLEESSVDEIRFTDAGVEWRGHSLDTAALRETRERFAASFGSCSFDEPVHDLKTIHLL